MEFLVCLLMIVSIDTIVCGEQILLFFGQATEVVVETCEILLFDFLKRGCYFTNTLEVYFKLTVRHDLSIIFHTFFFLFNLLCNYLILLCKSYTFLSLGDTLQLGLHPVRLSGHVTIML